MRIREWKCVTIPHGGLGTTHVYPLSRKPALVAIPHGGLRTVCPEGAPPRQPMSPSHTVGSEPKLKTSRNGWKGCHHPTRWARNYISPFSSSVISTVTIPHGGLGTLCLFLFRTSENFVTIPHGGLGTWIEIRDAQSWDLCHHPTRWARNLKRPH